MYIFIKRGFLPFHEFCSINIELFDYRINCQSICYGNYTIEKRKDPREDSMYDFHFKHSIKVLKTYHIIPLKFPKFLAFKQMTMA